MDLTTLAMAIFVAIAALGFDTVMRPTDVIVEASTAGKLEKVNFDDKMVEGILRSEVDRVAATRTLVGKPRVELAKQGGVGMAIANAVNMQSVAYALQHEVGYQPDHLRLILYTENDTTKVLVTGSGRQRVGSFEQEIEQQKGETVVALVHRAALVGMARIDPYLTTLSLMQRHASDKDFTDAESLMTVAKAHLAPTPINPDRSLFENLQGILALFRGNKEDAHTWFKLAMASSPDNTAAALNHAFSDLQLGHYDDAANLMEQVVREKRTADPTLLSTAYFTWAAALLGLRDVEGADRIMADAVAIKPASSVAWEFWSEVKRQKNDATRADWMHQQALNASDGFENYAEVAALYFRLAWKDNQPVARSQFFNTPVAAKN